jgi:NADH-quinone oxidoreductase subunit A
MVSLLPILFVVLFAGLVVAGMLVAPYLVAPRRDTPVKLMPYESGMDPVGDARGHFDVRFYLVAIVFLLFDVELLFLYPWAVAAWSDAGLHSPEAIDSDVSPTFVFLEVLLFIGLLGLAYIYAWRRGVFNWK